jgi:hypothetical protein
MRLFVEGIIAGGKMRKRSLRRSEKRKMEFYSAEDPFSEKLAEKNKAFLARFQSENGEKCLILCFRRKMMVFRQN